MDIKLYREIVDLNKMIKDYNNDNNLKITDFKEVTVDKINERINKVNSELNKQ